MFDPLVLSFKWCKRYHILRSVIRTLLRIDIVLAVFATLSSINDVIKYGLFSKVSITTVILTLPALMLYLIITYLIVIAMKCKELWEVV